MTQNTRLLLIIGIVYLIINPAINFAQTPASLIDNLQPTSPTAWQFTKYTDLPVSEYTGIPSISVPLYEVDVDGVKVPLNLTYYAVGNRVNQEASWVGLGWDLTVGSIVQTINGKDDFSTDNPNNPHPRFQPDYPGSPETTQLPFRYNYPFEGVDYNGLGWYTPYPSSTPVPTPTYQAFEIATDYYIPIATNFNTRAYDQFTDPNYDWEPDVFKANFLGHSINFMLDWSTNQIVVLNKKGYKVTRNSDDTWSIIVPDGVEYDFVQKDAVTTTSLSSTFYSYTGGPSLSSKIWMLTKIITKNKKQVLLNYTTTGVNISYPSFTQKLMNAGTSAPSLFVRDQQANIFAYSNAVFTPILGNSYAYTYSFSQEAYTYLSSINFPNGQVNFITSSRSDMNGALKLDSVAVTTDQLVKSYKLNYGYLNSTGVGGNVFKVGDTTIYNSTANYYRLQLQSIIDNSGAKHTFTYNSTLLPAKNSFATDIWGYYNGQLTNTSLVPNPSRYNITTFGNTGDNHSANLPYTEAGILQEIQYPTGGKVDFNYELNAFNNYFVPDFATTTNTISHGNGLRIQSVTYKESNGTQLKKDVYTYSTGKAVQPITMLRTYPASNLTINSIDNSGQVNYFLINEFNPSGLFSPNLLGSITGVGYDTVSHQEVDVSGNAIGKTTSVYYNTPDVVNNSASSMSQLSANLPAIKNYSKPDNGTLKYQAVYDNNYHLLKRNIYSYTTIKSPLYYGSRSFGYTNYSIYFDGGDGLTWQIHAQNMVGYYPLFDLETLMLANYETQYFGTDSVASSTNYTYDSYNQLITTSKTNSTYTETTNLTYPYNYPTNAVLIAMTSANRLSDIIKATKSTPNSLSVFKRNYKQVGNLYVANSDTTYNQFNNPEGTGYDQYDPANGNILQYSKNTVPNSFIWDYNKEYVIAGVKNALYTNVAYTSFEADGGGRWKFTGGTFPDPAAPTGQKVYKLNNGNIYRDSLDATKTYIVSYWSKSGAQTVSGGSAAKQGYTFSGYTYFEHTVTNPASGTITVSGTGTIDELRLYPNTAQMTSYTYAPLVGITSESTAGGKIAYYEYDYAMRLLDIRDQNNNILKAFCYNYAGQPTSCGLGITYSNHALAETLPRNNCSTGYTPTSPTYTVAMGKYTSTMSVQDADNQAIADTTANAQNYANANGGCALNITFTISNSSTDGYQVNFSNSSFNITKVFLNPGTKTITIPQGSYTLDVEPTGTYTNHTFTLGSQPPITGTPRTYFYSVNVAPGSTDLTLSIQ